METLSDQPFADRICTRTPKLHLIGRLPSHWLGTITIPRIQILQTVVQTPKKNLKFVTPVLLIKVFVGAFDY